MIQSQEIILRLVLGAIIGGIIGFEREIHGRAAGFRTQLIVCVAAVLIMIVSENYYYYVKEIDPTLRIDPARIAAGAIIGIGFLGGGVIIKGGNTVRGLTTAASIWIVSVIGLAIGAGLYLPAVITSIITVIALLILRLVETNIKKLSFSNVTVTTKISEGVEDMLADVITGAGMNISSTEYEKDLAAGGLTYSFHVSTRDKKALRNAFNKLGGLEFVRAVRIDSRDRTAP